MRIMDPFAVAALCAALTARAMPAQAPSTGGSGLRPGSFVVTVGAGIGAGGADMKAGMYPDMGINTALYSSTAVSYDLFLGYAISSRLRVGAEMAVSTNGNQADVFGGPGDTGTAAYYTAAIAYYPFATAPFWAKVNAGYGTLQLHTTAYPFVNIPGPIPLSASGGGFAAGIGVGYDWHPTAGALILVPFANYMKQDAVVRTGSGVVAWRGRPTLLQFGVGVGCGC